jgi:hypothetical protein
LTCPAPIPAVTPSRANTIAFDLTWRTTVQANSMSRSCRSVGARSVTTLRFPASIAPLSRDLDQQRAGDRLDQQPALRALGSSSTSSSRRFFLAANAARASSSAPGATTTSVKISVIAAAVAPSSGGWRR